MDCFERRNGPILRTSARIRDNALELPASQLNRTAPPDVDLCTLLGLALKEEEKEERKRHGFECDQPPTPPSSDSNAAALSLSLPRAPTA